MAVFIVDGHRVQVHTASELVRYMHDNARTQAADDKAYMLDVADRTVLQSGAKLRTDSAEAFVNDLVGAGLLECVWPSRHDCKPAPNEELVQTADGRIYMATPPDQED